MEAKIGRLLLKSEVVLHVDGVRTNNEPANLHLFRVNSEHLKAELTGSTPEWTEDGKARIAEGIRLAAAIHRKSKSDDDLRILSKFHRT